MKASENKPAPLNWFNKLAKFVGWWFLIIGGVLFAAALFDFYSRWSASRIPDGLLGFEIVTVLFVSLGPITGFALVRASPHYPKKYRANGDQDT